MSKTFRTLDDVDVKGKRVLLRVDLNVPMQDGMVTDTTRIDRLAPTIKMLTDHHARVILLSHFGRPKGYNAKESLAPLVSTIAGRLGHVDATTTMRAYAHMVEGRDQDAADYLGSILSAGRPARSVGG